MTSTMAWTRPALSDQGKLDRGTASRIRHAVIRLARTGRGNVARLADARPPAWRLRGGDRREFFRFRGDVRQIPLLRVRRRDGAYR